MATTRKSTKKTTKKTVKPKDEVKEVKSEEIIADETVETAETEQKSQKTEQKSQKIAKKEEPVIVQTEISEDEPEIKQEPAKKHKFSIGSIVFINKNADTDLNGFKLFPQYKKYTYTVEAYDQISDVYTLRRLNLSLRLKEDLIIAPNERAHDSINRRQF